MDSDDQERVCVCVCVGVYSEEFPDLEVAAFERSQVQI